MNVLVTGGAGYIGSHAALRLLEAGHRVIVIDDLSRGNRGAIDVLAALGSKSQFTFIEGDFGDPQIITSALRDHNIETIMHFAAWTYVGESVEEPLRYYRNNAAGALTLLEAMETAGVWNIVFSSTCATYGEPPAERIPIREDCPQNPINPYGRSKLHVENMLFDHAYAKNVRGEPFAFAALRYFNVAGNDPEARLGEDHDPETHIIPICLDAALGKCDGVTIFGNDYDTPDGTCIRDYVHVTDLVDAHIAVMNALQPGDAQTYNVGIGRGYSVREVIDACLRVTNVNLAVREGKRRPGDPPTLFAEPQKIHRELKWQAKFDDLDAIIDTAWRWRQAHPNGYQTR